MTRSCNANRERVAELVACLMKGARTVREITEMVEISNPAARFWIEALHAAGVVRISGVRKTETGTPGKYPAVYEWQRMPFEFEDFAP